MIESNHHNGFTVQKLSTVELMSQSQSSYNLDCHRILRYRSTADGGRFVTQNIKVL